MPESKIVTAVGISVNHIAGPEVSARLEKAMSDAVLECNAEGISTSEENSQIIRERMAAAHDRVLAEIAAENEAARLAAEENNS